MQGVAGIAPVRVTATLISAGNPQISSRPPINDRASVSFKMSLSLSQCLARLRLAAAMEFCAGKESTYIHGGGSKMCPAASALKRVGDRRAPSSGSMASPCGTGARARRALEDARARQASPQANQGRQFAVSRWLSGVTEGARRKGGWNAREGVFGIVCGPNMHACVFAVARPTICYFQRPDSRHQY